MIIFLFSDKKNEEQAISCISSLENAFMVNGEFNTIIYYTIGFKSEFSSSSLIIEETPIENYPVFNYYKPKLALHTLNKFKTEENFAYCDIDILFSPKIKFKNLEHKETYPLACFGPHEYPFLFEINDDSYIQFNETKLMDYFNVKERSQRYLWSCFFVFNRKCEDFLEEYFSICSNSYLLKNGREFLPFYDETAFNICLWKRNAHKNFGYTFVNTNFLKTVKLCEENNIRDIIGENWEYIFDSRNVLFYHGFKTKEDTIPTLNYLLSKNEPQK